MSADFDGFDFDLLLSDNEANDGEAFAGDLSDLEDTQSHVANKGGGAAVRVKTESGDNSKKRKYNPDSEIIAEETERTLREQGIDPQSKEGKAKRRQIRNRLSAQFHRNRKNAHMDTMQQLLNEKDVEIRSLRNEVARLVAENEYLRKFRVGTLPAGAALKRDHAYSVTSYPDINCGGSNPHTDSEETTRGQGQYHDLYSTCSSVTATASPSDSPYRVAMDSASLPQSMTHLPPSVGVNNVNGGSNSRTVSYVVGPGMMQVSGMARPLSIVTLVCMVSIMLLGTSHGPTMGVNLFTPYKDHIVLKDQHSPLKAGSEMLTLVHSAAGIETRYAVEQVEQRHDNQLHTHGRRLSDVDSEDEESQTSHQSSKRSRADSQTEGRERSNSLYDPTLMTPEEEAAATSAISALNLEHLDVPIPSMQEHSHTHLRHNLASHQPAFQPRRNASRQVIYSSGVVNRGLVEDSVVYPDQKEKRSFAKLNRDNDSAATGSEGDNEFDSQDYSWPASQAFDYAVQSYSTVVMTDGQALLDPAMVLHKNPFQWNRSMYKYRNRNVDDSRSPTILEQGAESFVEDMDVSEESHQLSAVRALPGPSSANAAETLSRKPNGGLVVPQTQLQLSPVVKQEFVEHNLNIHNNLPAVIENRNAFDSAYSFDGATEQRAMNKILAESNFITMKVPASSIRVGKTWSDSKSGTVESLMEVFNITNPNAFEMPISADASVEITGIIVGAKLVLSD